MKDMIDSGLTKLRFWGFRTKRQMYMALYQEEGVGVVEVILILVVLIGLVIIFKQQLTSLVNSIFKTITSQSATI